jgi:metallo-beta-lactamase class B
VKTLFAFFVFAVLGLTSQIGEVASWVLPADPAKIVGPIHFVGTRGLGVYLITTPKDGHILLFGGLPISKGMIEENIRELGFEPEDIEIILTCHAHFDHVGTHAHFQKLSGAKVMMMAPEVELLSSGGETDFHYGSKSLMHFDRVTTDRVLQDGDTVTLGDVTMTAHWTPGHTKGGTTWSMKVVDGGVSYLVVFPDGTSVNPGYRLVKDPSYPRIADDYRRTFDVLEKLEPDIWLHSHTSFFDFSGKRARVDEEGVKAWVDPQGYRAFVAEKRKTFEEQVAAEEREIDDKGGTP